MFDRRSLFILLFPFLFSVPAQAQNGIITTIAGNGIDSFSGDGAAAIDATLNRPFDVVVDDNGNLYIADTDNNRVRKISPAGVITTVAGDGTAGSGGDGGPAVDAQVNRPRCVTVDKDGNVYIGEFEGFRVRKIDISTGIITTIAGTGVNDSDGDGGPAVSAKIGQPNDLDFDSAGNLYIVDFHEHVVRKIDTNGIITSFAGVPGQSGYGPYNIPATSALVSNLTSIAFDDTGNAYISDQYPSVIYKVDTFGILTQLAGDGQLQSDGDGGPLLSASFHNAGGLLTDTSGNLYITEILGGKIRKINDTGLLSTYAGTGSLGFSGDGGAAINAEIQARSIAKDKWGRMFIADVENNRIRMIDTAQVPASLKSVQASAGVLEIYPNPAISGKMEINIPSQQKEKAVLVILNAAGQEIKRLAVTTGSRQSIRSDVASGTYFLVVTGAKQQWLGKVTVVE